MALRHHRDNGDQYEDDETLGNYDNFFQLRLRLHFGTPYGDGGESNYLFDLPQV